MNCRSAQSLLLSETDGVLTSAQHAELASHLATCASCRAMRADLAAALETLRSDVQAAPLPDIEAEWRAVQAKINAPGHAAPAHREKRRLAPIVWISAPLTAAAAVALALFVGRPLPGTVTSPVGGMEGAAQADFVEVSDPNATPIVYTDKDSGWLVVWTASDNTAVHS